MIFHGSSFYKHRSVQPGQAVGKCDHCRLLYRWAKGKSRRLKRARCAKCDGHLVQTNPASLPRAVCRSAPSGPRFEGE